MEPLNKFRFLRGSTAVAVNSNITDSTHISDGIVPANDAFMIAATALLWLQVPGCGFFYAGMSRSTSALSMLMLSLWTVSVTSIQWFVCGYSLSFSLTSGNSFIGDFSKAFFNGIYTTRFPEALSISELSFCLYQGVTAMVPTALLSGAFVERARVLPAVTFIFLWLTFIYGPLAYWSLNPNGWSHKSGCAPIHAPAGAAAIVYSYFLGPRKSSSRSAKPHSMFCIVLGSILIWFGGFGYNAGSAFAATEQATLSCVNMNLAASSGAIGWVLFDLMMDRKLSPCGLFYGAVNGIVVITPASGYINPKFVFVISSISVVVCNFGCRWKTRWELDDAMDVFMFHGLSGIVGMLLTGVFAEQKYVIYRQGGWVDGNFVQVLYQALDTTAGFFYSLTVSFILLLVITRVLRLKLTISLENEGLGMDIDQFGSDCHSHIEDLKSFREGSEWKLHLLR